MRCIYGEAPVTVNRESKSPMPPSGRRLEHDEIRLIRKGNGSALPLPLWERVGVRGYGLTIDRNPSPGSHLAMRSDLSRKGRGEVSPLADLFNQ
jgi:hypothetical protein